MMMKSNKYKNAEERQTAFWEQLEISRSTRNNYNSALKSQFMKDCVAEYGVESIFEITDLKLLWILYCKINLHPINVKNHRGHSAAVMKYIRFLNDGKKLGRRIDFNKPRKLERKM